MSQEHLCRNEGTANTLWSELVCLLERDILDLLSKVGQSAVTQFEQNRSAPQIPSGWDDALP